MGHIEEYRVGYLQIAFVCIFNMFGFDICKRSPTIICHSYYYFFLERHVPHLYRSQYRSISTDNIFKRHFIFLQVFLKKHVFPVYSLPVYLECNIVRHWLLKVECKCFLTFLVFFRLEWNCQFQFSDK
jgi:hypothetical protein